jgi:cytochrome c-type biogenesis protein CcmE
MKRRRKRSLIVVALVSMPTAAAVYLLMYHLTDSVPVGIFVGAVVGVSVNLVMGPR